MTTTTRFDFEHPDDDPGPRRLFNLNQLTPELVRLASAWCPEGKYVVVQREQLPTHDQGTEHRVRAQNAVSARLSNAVVRLLEQGVPTVSATRTRGNVITAYLRVQP